MPYLALLRGINVGGNNIIAMSKLKALFEKLGFSDVSTYINSGNVIFSDSKHTVQELTELIENGIQQEFGLSIRIVLRTKEQIESICKAIASDWVNDAVMRTDVLFLWPEVDTPEIMKSLKTNPEVDHVVYLTGAVVWHFLRENYTKSKMHDLIGTKLYKLMTVRNINTTRKLLQLMK